MIGGIVIETIVLADKVWINTRDKCSTSECAIYVELTDKSKCVSDGDIVWWQSSNAYWTPSFYKQQSGKDGRDFDIKLKRIGFSGVSRPELAKERTE